MDGDARTSSVATTCIATRATSSWIAGSRRSTCATTPSQLHLGHPGGRGRGRSEAGVAERHCRRLAVQRHHDGPHRHAVHAVAQYNPTNAGHARPNRIADGNLPRSERSAERWFDPAAFAPPDAFTYGDAGRNILIGPGFFNTDFGLFKRFQFNGPARRNEIQVRIEAFNIFNEPHYRQPNATVDLLDAGRITGIVGTMREMQIGIKYLF